MLVLLIACQPVEGLSGDLLLWYAADDADTNVLGMMVAEYEETESHVNIIALPIPADELADRYTSAAAQGLGPDVVLGSAEFIHQWAKNGLIKPVDASSMNVTLPVAQLATVYQEQTYGVPLAVYPLVLYYNTDRVSEPAVDLNQWLVQAREGQRILLHNRLQALFWGVPAFNGTLMDNTGQITLAFEPVLNWLSWLKTAQADGDLIISRDDILLQDRFLSGDAAYILADSRFLMQATSMLTDTVGITTLPRGISPSGSLVEVEAFMLNKNAGPVQTEVATHLISYLTNAEQSATWLRETGRVPANQNTRVDRRLYPFLAIVAEEAKFGLPYSADIDLTTLRQLGGILFADVLSGSDTPENALCEFGRNLQAGYPDQFNIAEWVSTCGLEEE